VSRSVSRISHSVWWANRAALLLLVALLLFGAGWFVYYAVQVAHYPYELGYTEGTILCLLREWTGGGSLYGSLKHPPYYVNIYPPGFYVIILALARVSGDPVSAGRLLASGSTLATAVLIFLLVARSRTTTSRAVLLLSGFVAATLFLASPAIMREGSILRVDMPAIFLALLGVFIYTEYAGRSAMQYLCVVPLVLALFVKQSMLAAPLACLAAGVIWYPAAAFRLFVFICAGLATLLLASHQMFGDAFLFHVFSANDLGFSARRSINGMFRFARYYYPLLGAAGLGVLVIVTGSLRRRAWPDLRYMVLLCYLILALAAMAMALSRPGTGDNWFAQSTTALCIFAGIGLSSLLSSTTAEAGSIRLAVMSLGLTILLVIQAYLYAGGAPRVDVAAWSVDQRRVVEHLRKLNGPVITNYSFLACIAGKTAYANQYMVAHLADAGRWDQTPYVESVKRKAVAGLVLRYDLDTTTRREIVIRRRFYTQEMLDAFRENYVLRARYGLYRIYEPKRGDE